MSRFSGILCSVVASFGLVAGSAVAAEPVVLNIHHFLPASSLAHTRFITPWCEKIKVESAGRLVCQIFPAMQMGGTPGQLIDQVRNGSVDIVWTMLGHSAGRFPLAEVFELPFMMTSAEATSRAVWDYVAQCDRDEFSSIKPLMFHVHGGGLFFMRDKPITRMEDLKGVTLRTPTHYMTATLEALDAIAMSMPAPQVHELLAKGVIAGTVFPYEVIPATRVDDLIRFVSEGEADYPKLQTSVFVFAMNLAKYESLPVDLQRVIDANSGAEMSAWAGHLWDAADRPVREALRAAGVPINVIPAAELDRWRAASSGVIAAWIASANANGEDGAALFEAAHSLITKHSKHTKHNK